MGAHRFWRLALPPINLNNGTLLSDVEVRGAIGGADVSGSAMITSNFTPVEIAPLFDGNSGTQFYAQAFGSASLSLWLAFEFASATTLAEVFLRIPSGVLAPDHLRVDYRDAETGQWIPVSPALPIGVVADGTTVSFSGWAEPGPTAVLLDALQSSSTGTGAVAPMPLPGDLALLRDVYHGGLGRVTGTVKVRGTPDYAVFRRVRLIRERDGVFVQETWSDPVTGAYEFKYVDPSEKYTALSYDHTHNFRAVVADNLTPEAL